jgi:hypothetical protein
MTVQYLIYEAPFLMLMTDQSLIYKVLLDRLRVIS